MKKKQLEEYFNFINSYDNKFTILDFEKKLDSLNLELNFLKNKINKISQNKIQEKKPEYHYNDIINSILTIFIDIDTFTNFYNDNNVVDIIHYNEYNCNLSFKEFQKNKEKIRSSLDKIDSLNNKINIINENNCELFKLNNTFTTKPETEIKLKSSKSVKNYLNTFTNINLLIKFNLDNLKIFESYQTDINEIQTLENNIKSYVNELELFANNDEYNYDPNCKFCSNRPWVIKINKLKQNIKIKNTEIVNLKKKIKNIDNIIKKYTKNEVNINKYNLYTSWYNYYQYIDLNILLKLFLLYLGSVTVMSIPVI